MFIVKLRYTKLSIKRMIGKFVLLVDSVELILLLPHVIMWFFVLQ